MQKSMANIADGSWRSPRGGNLLPFGGPSGGAAGGGRDGSKRSRSTSILKKKGAGWDGRYGRKKGEVREGKGKGKASNDFR